MIDTSKLPMTNLDDCRQTLSVGGLVLWIAKTWPLDNLAVQVLVADLFPGWTIVQTGEFIKLAINTVAGSEAVNNPANSEERRIKRVLHLGGGRLQ